MSRDIDTLLKEPRTFPPPAAFAAKARVAGVDAYEALYRRAEADPDGFWGDLAGELHWFAPWRRVLDWQPPRARWFDGGETNLAANCLDRHLDARGDHTAILWEGEPGEVRRLTYRELHAEVCRFANALARLGVARGDRVCIYMPMVPELAIALLACARLGAPHSVVFGGFAAHALRDRIIDAGAKVVLTADGGFRRGKVVALKAVVDQAVAETPSVERVVVLKRTGEPVDLDAARDVWWHDAVAGLPAARPPERLPAEHPLFILYTSGTTGKPKGIVHTTGGYMVGVYATSRWVFDLRPDDVYWCTADIGWVTGHSYVVYGPLLNGVTTVMYEGAPDHPARDRLWSMIARHRVTIFYTAPTAIRTFVKWGEEPPRAHDLTSLRLLGTVGEPINPEAWMWYHRVIGGERCPIVDTWWQTETGAIMISPLPGATATRPGSATRPLPGVVPDIVDKEGRSVPAPGAGRLVLTRPWPSMLRTLWGDDDRYVQQYWSQFPGRYFTGDGAYRDERGYYWLLGRIDDVINTAGHRLGTAEVEHALVSHPDVAEAAVVGFPDEVKGEAIGAFVTLKEGRKPGEALREAIRGHVAREIGALARPQQLHFARALPKTRSGKIMRRLLRDIAAGREIVGDTSTLEDYGVLAELREADEA